jgi:hypothetical protein
MSITFQSGERPPVLSVGDLIAQNNGHRSDFDPRDIFRTFPLRENDKRPAVKDWQNVAEIQRIDGNYGIRCGWIETNIIDHTYGTVIETGATRCLVVIDDDDYKGFASLNKLPELPETYTVRTAHGGKHYYFWSDVEIRNNQNAVQGVDWRGEGGFVVGPGSVVDGSEYVVLNNAPIADLPKAWVEILTGKKKLVAQRHQWPNLTSDTTAPSTECHTCNGPCIFPLIKGSHHDSLLAYIGIWRSEGRGTAMIRTLAHAVDEHHWDSYITDDPKRGSREIDSMVDAVDTKEPLRPEPERKPRYRLTDAADVKMQPVDWAWQGRIPAQMVTLLVGSGGEGKSTFLMYLAARWSRGDLVGEWNRQPVNIAISSAEDVRERVLKPRLMAAGADMRRVKFLDEFQNDESVDDVTLTKDIAELEEMFRDNDIKVWLIDPLVAHLDDQTDTYKDQHVRRALKPLVKMAERLGMVVLPLLHTNRKETETFLNKISASAGFGNLARSILWWTRKPEDDERSEDRYLVHGKCNVDQLAWPLQLRMKPISYWVDAEGNETSDGREVRTITYEEVCEREDLRMSDFLAKPFNKRQPRDLAQAWLLRNIPTEGEDAAVIRANAKDAGHSRETLDRAFEEMEDQGLVRREQRPGNRWFWFVEEAGS